MDNAAKAGAFSRVAYVMELVCKDDSVDWAVAAMDAFTADAAQLGVPAVTKAFFQQKVGNLVVRSNRACVKEGPQEGAIEFFNGNYGPGAKLAGVGGDGKVYDSVLYVVNTATVPVRLSLPTGHTYVTVSGLAPLLLPASSTNLVTITRMAADTFLVTRQSLEAIK